MNPPAPLKFGNIYVGAEVKNGQIFEVELEDDGSRILHLSQVIKELLLYAYLCVELFISLYEICHCITNRLPLVR